MPPTPAPGTILERRHQPAGSAQRPPWQPSAQTPHPPNDEALYVRAGWAIIEPCLGQITAHTFARLFLQDPTARRLFGVSLREQRRHLAAALRAVVAAADDPARLTAHFAAVGRGCATLGAHPQQVAGAAAALLQSLAAAAGPAWTDSIRQAWEAAIGRATRELLAAAAATPAGCQATIVRHRRISADVAILTVLPDEPYPYSAGQHAAVRLLRPGYDDTWRTLAFGSAPNTSGHIMFVVRSNTTDLVSRALVAHVRPTRGHHPGDRIRLGPPLGHQLVTGPASDRGLVLVADGYGIAAARAILDQLARWDEPPPVRTYIGLRDQRDAYLLDVVGAHHPPPGRPVGVAADGAGWTGPAGPVGLVAGDLEARRLDHAGVPELLRDRQHVLLAGPQAMVRDAAIRFARLGVPPDRIHADALTCRAAYRTLVP